MKKGFTRLPWFYILFTFYPLLFLWAVNISQMDPAVVIRPFLFTLVGSAILYGLLYLILRDGVKAALIGTLLLIAYFSYGHVYYAARTVAALKILNHHYVLVPLYAVLLGLGSWGILRIKKYDALTLYLNAASLILVLIQVVELSYAYIETSYAVSRPIKYQSGLTLTTDLKDMPDIYVIVLDTYMRSDALKQDLGYDNSPFINQLKDLGFYVASCGHPDYTFTYASISAMLNMRYIPGAYANDVWDDFSDSGFWSNLLKNNEVRAQLKSVGYKTVAFQEEYPLVEFNNSDVLIGTDHPTINSAYLYPFEVMYQQSTAAIILPALDPSGKLEEAVRSIFAKPDKNTVDLSGLKGANKDFVATHIISTNFILDHITDIPAIAGPKFAYIHLFIPHAPFVYGPDGQIETDPGYYGGDRAGATSEAYQLKGYVNQVQYIDKRIVPILQTVISKSKNPPIIILMGDHGLENNNRRTDLLAYYLPKNGEAKLYPTISPVNSFRLIFDEYFGANYPLLPDITYIGDKLTAPDPFPGCAP
ncbi:MAG TPA: sulfatase-like hydrolase/transferase [Anaerolineales bacterium]|nr:sulfatase-like hydrolase/transferase [Anaerolineales bacterium]